MRQSQNGILIFNYMKLELILVVEDSKMGYGKANLKWILITSGLYVSIQYAEYTCFSVEYEKYFRLAQKKQRIVFFGVNYRFQVAHRRWISPAADMKSLPALGGRPI